MLIYNEPCSFRAAQVVNQAELALDRPSVAELLAKAYMCIYIYICIYHTYIIHLHTTSRVAFCAAQVVNKVELALDRPSVAELLAKAQPNGISAAHIYSCVRKSKASGADSVRITNNHHR